MTFTAFSKVKVTVGSVKVTVDSVKVTVGLTSSYYINMLKYLPSKGANCCKIDSNVKKEVR